MYVIKMKTIISYIAVVAIIIASFGIIKLNSAEAVPSSMENSIDSVCVPIIMYHNIMKTNTSNGRFIVTEKQFEEDLKFLKENNYTTIVMEDLINYVYAHPLMKEYGYKGVLSIIGYYTDMYTENGEKNVNYSHITWNDIKDMLDSETFEFQNHSYNLHSIDKGRNGSKKKKGESKAEYTKILTEDLGKLQTEFKDNIGIELTTYTYPFGSVSTDSYDIIKDLGFKCSLSCESGINTITKDPECLYMLKRTIRTPSSSVQKILNIKK